jgi:lichenan operon transcriptional antiterminator
MDVTEDSSADLREDLICVKIIQNKYTLIEDLCDTFFFSRSSLSPVLKSIKAKLSEYGITIKSRPHYGLYVTGTEENKRNFLTRLLLIRKPGERNKIFNDYIPLKKALLAKKIVIMVLRNHAFTVTDNFLEEIILQILIVLIRFLGKHRLPVTGKPFGEFKKTKEYIMANKILEQFKNIFSIDSDDSDSNEAVYISKLLTAKKKYDAGMIKHQNSGNIIAIESALRETLEILKGKFKVDLCHDLELYTSLLLHTIPLVDRVQLESPVFNPLIDEIKTYYPYSYEIAVDAALVLGNKLSISIGEHETGYLAAYLQLALERQKHDIIPKRVLVVCPAGRSMSQLVAYNLREEFKDYIGEIETGDVYQLASIDLNKFDYIFTTAPLDIDLPVPVIFLPYKFNKNNIKELKNKLNGTEIFQIGMREMIPKEHFCGTLKVSGKPEIIRGIIEILKTKIELPDDFYDQILERERTFPTEIDNMIAFPHPISDGVNKSFLSVSILAKPVRWESKIVQIVFLGSVKKGDGKRLQLFYHQFSRFCSNREYAIKLIEKPNFEVLLSIINELEEESGGVS